MGCSESKTKDSSQKYKEEQQQDDGFSNVDQKTHKQTTRTDSQVREDSYLKAPTPYEDEDDDDDDTEMPPVFDSKFKGGGPTMQGDTTECFKGGLLYRIVNDETWAFYNDTSDYEMHVTWKFGPDSNIQPLGAANLLRDENDWFVVSCIIYPGETEQFIKGTYNGYKSSASAKPLSEEYRNRINAEADEKVNTELESLRKLVRNSDDEERNLTSCLGQKVPYLDVNFLPHHSSLSRPEDSRQLPPSAWKRPTDYLPSAYHEHIKVYRKIEPNDIDQGALGDCWFLCSVASLAEFPSKIKDIFSHPVSDAKGKEERAVGAYRVTLNKHGWWHMMIVDDYFPVVGNKPCFAKNIEDPAELWVSLLEKAYAKVHGSYSTITGGDALHALQDLTGYPINRFDDEWEAAVTSDEGSEELFTDLVRYDVNNYLINLNTPGNDNSAYMGAAESGNSKSFEEKYRRAGLGMGHAYSVLQVKEFPEHKLRLLQVRNPWGNGTEWTGDWCDDDAKWEEYPDVAQACDFVKAEDGTFWMTWEDVKQYFDGGGVCFTKFNWFDYRAMGAFQNGFPNLALQIIVNKPTKMFAILSQKDKRGLPEDDPDSEYVAMMLSITRDAGNGKQQVHLNSTSDADKPLPDYTFSYSRDLAMEYEFLPEYSPYYVVPRIYDAGASKSYVLGVISETRVGSDVQINLRTIDKHCRIFQNYPKFAVDDRECNTNYQFNPEKGCPVTRSGTQFTN